MNVNEVLNFFVKMQKISGGGGGGGSGSCWGVRWM